MKPDDQTGFEEAPDVVQAVFDKHRSGGVSDVRARTAIVSYVTALAPANFFSADDLITFEVFVDIALQGYRRAPSRITAQHSVDIVKALGQSDADALAVLRARA